MHTYIICFFAWVSKSVSVAESFHFYFAAQRDEDLMQIERRNFFSLLCLDLEAQVIHAYLALIPEMLMNLVRVECIGHEEVGKEKRHP